MTPEVVNAHARQITSGLAHFWGRVHDSAPISRPIFIKFGDSAKDKNMFS